jgi:glycogen synthase kinase 3 beta
VIKDLDRKVPPIYMPIGDIKRYTKEILNGLHSMHSLRIVHRDLKPENILIKNGQVKICDMGSSKFIDESPAYKNTPYVVSRYYRAPELIFASNKYNEAIDIWAVGCILFELITKTPLFPGDTEGLQILE